MNWLKVNKDSFEKVQVINPNKGIYLYNLSPKAYVPTEDEDKELNCSVISVRVEKALNTAELNQLLQEVQDKYDKSNAVNCFMLEGEKIWLNKETRVGLINSVTIQQSAGVLVTTLWLNNKPYNVSVEYALAFLKNLELYAIDCYNVTQSHLADIRKITNRDELFLYDITAGYPTPLEFNSGEIIEV